MKNKNQNLGVGNKKRTSKPWIFTTVVSVKEFFQPHIFISSVWQTYKYAWQYQIGINQKKKTPNNMCVWSQSQSKSILRNPSTEHWKQKSESNG